MKFRRRSVPSKEELRELIDLGGWLLGEHPEWPVSVLDNYSVTDLRAMVAEEYPGGLEAFRKKGSLWP